jgi:hypothetical protein
MMQRWATYVLLTILGSGCFAPVSPTQRVSDAARDLNVGTRFGKMDFVASYVDPQVRADFMARRTDWGREIRLVDLDLSSVAIRDATHATVTVDVSWVPLRDNTLRSTRVEQNWQDNGRGWLLVRERRLSGDRGLFGEVIASQNAPHPDVHLPTKTLGLPQTREQ